MTELQHSPRENPGIAGGERIFVVVVNYRTSENLSGLLGSLTDEGIDRVVIVDNWSDEKERGYVRSLASSFDRCTVLELSSNTGFGAGVNSGIEFLSPSATDFVFVLNPDTRVAPGATKLLANALRDDGSDIVGPTIVTGHGADPEVWFSGGTFDEQAWRLTHVGLGSRASSMPTNDLAVNFLTGAAFMTRGSTWYEIGGFDESLFLYWEDLELCLRACDLGLKLTVVRSAVVWHAVGAASGGGQSETFFYYLNRNRVRLLIRRSGPSRLLAPVVLVETARLLLRPLREPEGRLPKLMAAVRGLASGLSERDRTGSDRPVRRASVGEVPGKARYYKTLRSAHLERTSVGAPMWTFYSRKSYDLDEDLLADSRFVKKVAVWRLPSLVRRLKIATIELNEPGMIRAWPQLLPLVVRYRLSRRVRLVTYAIENLDPAEVLAARARVPLGIARKAVYPLFKFLLRGFDRVAFGTSAAMNLYCSLDAEGMRGIESKLFSPLPTRGVTGDRPRTGAVFVGSFEQRKGILELLAAWPLVEKRMDTSLTIIGRGPLASEVRRAVLTSKNLTVVERPARHEILSYLASSSVLILFSQDVPGWREQIGLPILEALAAGCTVVTSDRTGIATELRALGHAVLPASSSAEELASVIVSTLDSPIRPQDVTAALPNVDGRLEAQQWLLEDPGWD